MLDLSEYFIVEDHHIPPSKEQRSVNLVLKGGGSKSTTYFGIIKAL